MRPSKRIPRPWFALLAAIAALLLTASPAGADAKEERFRVVDELGPGQIEELITVSIDGRTIGVLRVTRESPIAELSVKVPSARRLRYQLCGYLVTETPEGGRRQHVVNQTGTILNAAGRELRAFNRDNTIFYLQDGAAGETGAAETVIGAAGQCAQPIALLGRPRPDDRPAA